MKQETVLSQYGEGDCYRANANFIIDLFHQHKGNRKHLQNYRLCHGDVIGAHGSLVEGKRFPHAWVEIDGRLILDFSNGKLIVIPKDRIQYRIFEDTVKRYTVKQTIQNVFKYEHYGAWE